MLGGGATNFANKDNTRTTLGPKLQGWHHPHDSHQATTQPTHSPEDSSENGVGRVHVQVVHQRDPVTIHFYSFHISTTYIMWLGLIL
jgi:hypothetical protein